MAAATSIESARKDLSSSTLSLVPGRVLARKYEVIAPVVSLASGALYTVSERATGIERTAQFFFLPDERHNASNNQDRGAREAIDYARRLHKLRDCPIVLQYRTQEVATIGGTSLSFVISERARGILLSDFLARHPRSRLGYFEALHLLWALIRGAEVVHAAGERLGSLATDTVLVRRVGLGFDVKLLALAGEAATAAARREDVWRLISLYGLLVGGEEGIARLPAEVRALCCGMRKQAVMARYASAVELRRTLDTLRWS